MSSWKNPMNSWKNPSVPVPIRILLYIRDEHGGSCPLPSSAIATAVEGNLGTVKQALVRMVSDGRLVRNTFGVSLKGV